MGYWMWELCVRESSGNQVGGELGLGEDVYGGGGSF